MIRVAKIALDAPVFNTGSTMSHTGTSYQISRSPDLTITADIVLDIVNDPVNLLEYRYKFDDSIDRVLYIRTKQHFTDSADSTTYESNWTNVSTLYSNQVGLKVSNTIINTPIVTSNIVYDELGNKVISISGSDFTLYGGVGNHISTTYTITDTDGKVYYERNKDVDNLLSILVPIENIIEGKTYICKITYHSDTNSDSNPGKTTLITGTINNNGFIVRTSYDFIVNKKLYCELTLLTSDFKNLDLILVDKLGNTIASNLGQTSMIPLIDIPNLSIGDTYTLKARIMYNDGIYSPYSIVKQGVASPNTIYPIDRYMSYLGKYDFTHYINTNGASVQNVYESIDGSILLGTSGSAVINKYKLVGRDLVNQGPAFTLSTIAPLGKLYFNSIPLGNGDILVDFASTDTGNGYTRPVFQVYSYDKINDKYTFQHELKRVDELHSTSKSASIDSVGLSTIYYIPAGLSVGGAKTPLEIRKYDPILNVISTVSSLPFKAYQHVSMVTLDEDNMLVLGGTVDSITGSFGVSYNRTNETIYKYNISTDTWVSVGDLTGIVPTTVYNLQSMLRKNGDVIMFNGVEDGISVGDTTSYIYNVITNSVTSEANDTGDALRYNSSVRLINGDIMRISSRTLDPQKIFTYIGNTIPTGIVSDEVSIDAIGNLVVPINTTITIEAPFRYNTISIDGTSASDSGVLRWVHDDKLYTYTYRDIILKQDGVELDRLLSDLTTWDSVTILDGGSLNNRSTITVPDGKKFYVGSGADVETITLGVGSEIIVIDIAP